MWLRYAVIGSGAHVATVCSDWLWCARGYGMQWLALVHTWLWWLQWTMLAEFVKHFWNNLFTVSLHTNVTLHTLEPRSSLMETLRSVWSWSAEIFEAQIHTHTHTHTHMRWAFLHNEYFDFKYTWIIFFNIILKKNSILNYCGFATFVYIKHCSLFPPLTGWKWKYWKYNKPCFFCAKLYTGSVHIRDL